MYFFHFGPKKYTESHQKNAFFVKKGDFELQYFTLRTIEKYGNFSLQNVLKISPNLRLSVLINFVLTKKKVFNPKVFFTDFF